MLYRYSEVFRTLIGLVDLGLVAGAWILAYVLRFHAGLPVERGIPALSLYLEALALILPVSFVLFRSQGLYEPQRTGSLLHEAGTIVRVCTTAVVGLAAVNFFLGGYLYSRGAVAIFALLAPLSIIASRVLLRGGLRALRRRGYNQRYVVVVGGGSLAGEIIDRIRARPTTGLQVRGVLAEGASAGTSLRGVPIVGNYRSLKRLVRNPAERVDQVILALDRQETHTLEKILAELDDEVVNVNLVPDLRHVPTLHSSVESLDGLPVINLRDTPLLGWAAVGKRVFDISVGSAALLLMSPVMLLIAGALYLQAERPILYRQERMGLDGRVFAMLKFRTMRPDAEAESGPVWTGRDDPRRTRLGRFLRRFSLDELPQLWNVLKGEMSLVGPRPERPVFIEAFRSEIPGYMLRHKVKAGMTGWAQIHGWRGDTSLHQRIEHDLYYIQNWSLGLDVRILIRTGWVGLFDSNAY